MGASLGHLLVCDYNLIKKEQVAFHCPIDCEVSDPKEKANKEFEINDEYYKTEKWDKSDNIVRVVYIPMIMQKYHGWMVGQEDKFDVSCIMELQQKLDESEEETDKRWKDAKLIVIEKETNKTNTYLISSFKYSEIDPLEEEKDLGLSKEINKKLEDEFSEIKKEVDRQLVHLQKENEKLTSKCDDLQRENERLEITSKELEKQNRKINNKYKEACDKMKEVISILQDDD